MSGLPKIPKRPTRPEAAQTPQGAVTPVKSSQTAREPKSGTDGGSPPKKPAANSAAAKRLSRQRQDKSSHDSAAARSAQMTAATATLHLIWAGVALAGILATGMFIFAGFAIYGLVILPNSEANAQQMESATMPKSVRVVSHDPEVMKQLADETPPPAGNGEPNRSRRGKPALPTPVQRVLRDLVARGNRLPLPPLSKSVGENPREVELAKIFVDTPDQCQLALLGTDVVFGSDTRNRVQIEHGKTVGTWEAFSTYTDSFGTMQRLTHGVFAIRNESLYFRWGNRTPNSRLKYCLLHVKAGGEEQKCSLLIPQLVSPLNIDPRTREVVVPIPTPADLEAAGLKVEFRLDSFSETLAAATAVPANKPSIFRMWRRKRASPAEQISSEPLADVEFELLADHNRGCSLAVRLFDYLPMTEQGKFITVRQASGLGHVAAIKSICERALAQRLPDWAQLRQQIAQCENSRESALAAFLAQSNHGTAPPPVEPAAGSEKDPVAWTRYESQMAAYERQLDKDLVPLFANVRRSAEEVKKAKRNAQRFESFIRTTNAAITMCDELTQRFEQLKLTRLQFKVVYEIDGERIVLIESGGTSRSTGF